MIITETTTEPLPITALRNFCNNNGVLHVNGTCICQVGYGGDNCKEASCDNYCINGICKYDNITGQPTCKCLNNSYGDRCEKQKCPCMNNGQCIFDTTSNNPRCECLVGYVGDICQFSMPSDWFNELCPVFCKHASTMSKSGQSVCR